MFTQISPISNLKYSLKDWSKDLSKSQQMNSNATGSSPNQSPKRKSKRVSNKLKNNRLIREKHQIRQQQMCEVYGKLPFPLKDDIKNNTNSTPNKNKCQMIPTTPEYAKRKFSSNSSVSTMSGGNYAYHDIRKKTRLGNQNRRCVTNDDMYDENQPELILIENIDQHSFKNLIHSQPIFQNSNSCSNHNNNQYDTNNNENTNDNNNDSNNTPLIEVDLQMVIPKKKKVQKCVQNLQVTKEVYLNEKLKTQKNNFTQEDTQIKKQKDKVETVNKDLISSHNRSPVCAHLNKKDNNRLLQSLEPTEKQSPNLIYSIQKSKSFQNGEQVEDERFQCDLYSPLLKNCEENQFELEIKNALKYYISKNNTSKTNDKQIFLKRRESSAQEYANCKENNNNKFFGVRSKSFMIENDQQANKSKRDSIKENDNIIKQSKIKNFGLRSRSFMNDNIDEKLLNQPTIQIKQREKKIRRNKEGYPELIQSEQFDALKKGSQQGKSKLSPSSHNVLNTSPLNNHIPECPQNTEQYPNGSIDQENIKAEQKSLLLKRNRKYMYAKVKSNAYSDQKKIKTSHSPVPVNDQPRASTISSSNEKLDKKFTNIMSKLNFEPTIRQIKRLLLQPLVYSNSQQNQTVKQVRFSTSEQVE